MEERTITDTNVKESLIGVAAASFSIFVIVAMMGGGGRAAFVESFTWLLYGYIAPIIFLPEAPWLVILYVLTGAALYFQYRHVSPRFMRYIVGAEIIVWQVIGFWLITTFLAIH